MDDLYPYDVPVGMHPLAWVFLGHGLDSDGLNALATHVFDHLGARLSVEERDPLTLRFAVDTTLDDTAEQFSVGDEFERVVAPDTGVRLVAGHLPPGIRLDRATGTLSGVFTDSGIYEVTFAFGPSVKWDALGTVGGPGNPGQWIDVNSPRAVAEPDLSAPAKVSDLPDSEKAQLLAELLDWEQARATEARNGN